MYKPNTDIRRWALHTEMPSDFDIILLNRNHVIMARRRSHYLNGVVVRLIDGSNLELTATFREFEMWMRGIEE